MPSMILQPACETALYCNDPLARDFYGLKGLVVEDVGCRIFRVLGLRLSVRL